MTSGDAGALWERLCAAGLATGDPPVDARTSVPWYVRTMVGVAAWIAACFLLAALGVAFRFVFENASAAMLAGLAMCGVAIALLRISATRDFAIQFALALSLAGQALVALGLYRMFRHDVAVASIGFAAFEVLLVVVAPNAVHRTWSSFGAGVLLLVALMQWHATFLFPPVIAAAFVAVELNQARLSSAASVWQPLSAGLALALLALVPVGAIAEGLRHAAPQNRSDAWLHALPIAAVFVGTVAQLLRRNGVALGRPAAIFALLGSAAFVAAAWPVPALVAALLVAVVAFSSGRVALTGLGLVAMAATLGYYYYALETTLLAKSMSLLAAGAVLLVARFAVRRWIAVPLAGADHA